MVGVPALATWVAGPSSLMCWPICAAAEVADEERGGEDGDPQRDASRDEQSEHVASGLRVQPPESRRPRGRRRTASSRAAQVLGSDPNRTERARRASTASSKGSRCPRPPGRSRAPCRRPRRRPPGRPHRGHGGSPPRGRARPRRAGCPARRACPPSTSSMMARGIFVARVVRRHERQVAQARGHAAHDGALGPVPVPAAPEDAQHPPARARGSEPRPAPPRAPPACARSRRAR